MSHRLGATVWSHRLGATVLRLVRKRCRGSSGPPFAGTFPSVSFRHLRRDSQQEKNEIGERGEIARRMRALFKFVTTLQRLQRST
jgi:hypothetical protein